MVFIKVIHKERLFLKTAKIGKFLLAISSTPFIIGSVLYRKTFQNRSSFFHVE